MTNEIKQKNWDVYLQHLSTVGTRIKAAELAGIDYQRLHAELRKNDKFVEQEELALKAFTENILEASAIQRATEGVEVPEFQGGKIVGHKKKFSDTLLMFLLKKFNPEYREKLQVDVEARAGVMVVTAIPATTDEWLQRYASTEKLPDTPKTQDKT